MKRHLRSIGSAFCAAALTAVLLTACGGGGGGEGTTQSSGDTTSVSGKVTLSGTGSGKPSSKALSAPSALVQAVVEMYNADRPEWQYPLSYAITDMSGDYKLDQTSYSAENGGSYSNEQPIPAGNYTVVAHKYDAGTGKLWVAVQPYVKRFTGDVLHNDLVAQAAGLDPLVVSMFGLATNGDNTFGSAGTSLSANAAIQMTFNTAMARLTVLNAITVADQAGAAVTGTLKISPDLMSVTFYPASPLSVGTLYTVTVRGGTDPKAAKNLYDRPLPVTVIGAFKCSNADTTPPNAIKISPNSQTDVATNTPIRIASNEQLDIHTFSIASSPSIGAKPEITYLGKRISFDEYKFVYEIKPDTGLLSNTDYSITVSGTTDIAGNPLTPLTFNFKTGGGPDTAPPTVSSTTPAAAATNVPLRPTVAATFNKPIDVTTVTPASFMLSSGGGYVLGYIFGNNSTASFVPSMDLAPGALYTATLTTAVKDPAGNSLASNYTWTFTTAPVPDTTPPWVLTPGPAGGAVNVPIVTTIKATFSEALDASTINTTTFTVAGVNGTVTYDPTTHAATFTPSSSLAYYTSYTATVAAGVKDLAGNAVINPYSWTFTTTIPPAVGQTDPPDGAKNVDSNKIIKATFTVPMDATTINASTFLVSGVTPSSVTYDAPTRTASFTPSTPYAYATTYTATITTGAKDQDGNPLPADYSWSFLTRPVPPPPTYDEKVNTNYTYPLYDYPAVIYKNNGDGLAVWYEGSGRGYRLMYSRYTAGATNSWSPEDVLDATYGVVAGSYGSPRIATNNTGFAVSWFGCGRGGYNCGLYAKIFDGSAWGATTAINMYDGYEHQLASNGAGYALTWRSSGIHAALYDPVTGWGAPDTLNLTGLGYATNPQLASNGSGYAVTWEQQIGSVVNIFASIYDGTSWTAPPSQPLSAPADYASSPRIASNGTGYAVAWYQYNSAYTATDVFTTIYDGATSTWGAAPVQIENTGSAYGPLIASNGTGYAVAWLQRSFNNANVCASIAPSVTGTNATWGAWTYLNSLNGNSWISSIVSNGAGYAVAWLTDYGAYHLYANVYKGSSWSATQDLIDVGNAPTSLNSQGVVRNGSNYTAVWSQADSQNHSNIHVRNYATSWGGDTTLVKVNAFGGSPSIAEPAIVTNIAGNALAVWVQNDSGNPMLFGNIRSAAGWGTPFRISTDVVPEGNSFTAATNGIDFMISWTQGSGIHYLYARTCTSSGSLGSAVTLSGSNSNFGLQMISNGAGYAISWSVPTGPQSVDVYASVYDGVTWSTRLLASSQQAAYSALASNGKGYAVAWQQWNATYNDIYAHIFDGASWSGAVKIKTNMSDAWGKPVIASNGAGYAVAWGQKNANNYYDIYANVFDGTAWGADGTLLNAAPNTNSDGWQIVSNGTGAGYTVAWRQSAGGVYANVYAGSAWGGSTRIDVSVGGYDLQLASNGSGCAVAWWDYVGGYRQVFSNAYKSGTGWAGAARLDTSSFGASAPKIASNGTSYAVIFEQYNGSKWDLFADTYTGTAWAGVKNLQQAAAGSGGNLYQVTSNGAGYAAIWLRWSTTDPIVYDVTAALGF